MERLAAAGEEAYIVGGGLRDVLLGREPNDYDVATSASPERMRKIFSDMRTVETGLKHGTLTVICDHRPVEITAFRVDGSYSDSRHPDSVSFTRSVAEDLARRDFTINAMAYNQKSGLVDLYGGISDLSAGLVRAVGEPERRFGEDALRILRAFRFAAQLGFAIESDTLSAAKKCRDGLKNIAKERICAEFLKLICSPEPSEALRLMAESGVMKYVLGDFTPEKEVLESIGEMAACDVARMGFLLVGCPSDEARELLCTLKCSNRLKNGALAIALNARRKITEPRDAARLCKELGDNAIFAAKASELLGVSKKNAEALVKNNIAPRNQGELAVSGRELEALGITGRDIGKTLAYLLEITLDDPSLNKRQTLLDIACEKISTEN